MYIYSTMPDYNFDYKCFVKHLANAQPDLQHENLSQRYVCCLSLASYLCYMCTSTSTTLCACAGAATLTIMTLSIATQSITTHSVMALSITTLSILAQ
jgi:hypothetical protein